MVWCAWSLLLSCPRVALSCQSIDFFFFIYGKGSSQLWWVPTIFDSYWYYYPNGIPGPSPTLILCGFFCFVVYLLFGVMYLPFCCFLKIVRANCTNFWLGRGMSSHHTWHCNFVPHCCRHYRWHTAVGFACCKDNAQCKHKSSFQSEVDGCKPFQQFAISGWHGFWWVRCSTVFASN